MDIVNLQIPYAFLLDRIEMTWQSIRFGIQNNLISPGVARDLAIDQIAQGRAGVAALKEIIDAHNAEIVADHVDKLAAKEPEYSEQTIKADWLYLVLAWTYEHQRDYPDPLQRVEEIYADFDYPETIKDFVRYMPMGRPDLGSQKANERRLLERWERYLEKTARSKRLRVIPGGG